MGIKEYNRQTLPQNNYSNYYKPHTSNLTFGGSIRNLVHSSTVSNNAVRSRSIPQSVLNAFGVSKTNYVPPVSTGNAFMRALSPARDYSSTRSDTYNQSMANRPLYK